MATQLDLFCDRVVMRMKAEGLYVPSYTEVEEFLAMGYPPDEPVIYNETNVDFCASLGFKHTGTMMEWITYCYDKGDFPATCRKIYLLWMAGARMRRDMLMYCRILGDSWRTATLSALLQADALVAFRTPATLLHKGVKGRWRRIPIELYRLLVGFLIPDDWV